jgi:hypothetical protein
MSPSRKDIPESTLLLFLALCDPFREEISGDISEASWTHISELSKLHGLTPFLFYRTRHLGIPVPEKIKKEWLGIYLYSLAQDQKARRQIKELKEILDPAGVPFILLKGASAMIRLYPEPGLRTFCDLDILIPVDKADQFKRAMIDGGYKPLSARNSPEDEELLKFDAHLDPLSKEEGIMIEAHINILGVKGDYSVVNPDAWQGKEETNTDGTNIENLNAEHFIIHTLLHYSRHLSEEGFAEIKWLVDLLYAIKAYKIDWLKVMDISQRWGVEKDVLPIMATLNHYFQTRIPLSITSNPIPINILVQGVEDRQKEYYANLPTSYLERLMKLRKLPDKTSQVRYLVHLFFPTQENLRWRYNLSSKWSILPYYFIHLLFTVRKVFTGLWYQSASYLFTKNL